MSHRPLSTEHLIVFGASGQLGSAVIRQARKIYRSVHPIAWESSDHAVKAYSDHACDYLFAGGVTDPRAPESVIRAANIELPQKVILAANNPGNRFMTVGTVMERFPDACAVNPYLKSKLELGLWMAEMASRADNHRRFLHVRLHTLYGGAPKPHMFLGQIAAAIRDSKEFHMSSGDQLREYHHADDIAESLLVLLRGSEFWNEPSVEISSGKPIRLSELAHQIFAAFGKENLLHVGTLVRPQGENLKQVFERSPAELLAHSREPVQGIIQWLGDWLHKTLGN